MLQLLESRDARARQQRRLLADYPEQTLLVLTVVIPGAVKRDARSRVIAHAAREAVATRFGADIRYSDLRDRYTGFEGYFIIDRPMLSVKRAAVEIEQTERLGRLFDLDVVRPDGTPLSRETVGASPRRCLLCEEEARICMRAHTHSPEELQTYITQLTQTPAGL